ncbi:hypothetical protein MVEG_01705 [Podila verticillata NRRL 6337]|nr:MAG: calcium-activated chloride channel-domain-containing protein [Podila humilis]KFH71406.1 hypothetical protein MVEG_01705 [Podila verticillata NRRL 6337]
MATSAQTPGNSPPSFKFHDIYASTTQTYTSASKEASGDKSEVLNKSARPKSLDTYADFVLVFKYKAPTKKDSAPSKLEYEQKTIEAYQKVITKLARVGLQHETRPSGHDTLLVFILCPWAVLKREATRDSIHDWLTGVKVADTAEAEQLLQPAKVRDESLDNVTDSDRLRLISELITGLPTEGGAGIHPGHDEFVDSILPLHDKAFNMSWLKSWSTKWSVNHKDLTVVRDHFGEKVAYYFEFLQFYFQWLAFPTGLGVLVHYFGSTFSIFYGVCVIFWSVIFTESWKRREQELALWWGVHNVSKTEMRRPEFKGDTIEVDPVTGEMTPFFSPYKRWTRKLAGLPVILGGALVLAAVITAVFGIEVFFTMYYDGYMKAVLIYVPMVLYSLAIPNVAAICKSVAKQLTEYENYETSGSYEYHLMQKVFIFNALTSYMSILLTAYIYIPFGPQVITTAQSYGLPFAKATIDTDMLQSRLRAFMITTQAVSFATETVVPWLTRRAMVGAVKVQKKVSHKLKHEISSDEEDHAKTECIYGDSAEAQKFLKRVKKQVDLPEYDVNEDYAEMVLQFGYVSLFSVIWPLTGLCAFLNNWVELRSDAAKISYNARRPIPSRTDTIGPWINNLNIIAWFSSLTNASILYLFHGTTDGTPRLGLGMLLLCILVSEHGYLALRSFAGLILDSVPTEAELDVRKKKYSVKSSWLSRLSSAIGVQSDELLGRVSPNVSHVDAALSAQLENDLGVQIIRSGFKSN